MYLIFILNKKHLTIYEDYEHIESVVRCYQIQPRTPRQPRTPQLYFNVDDFFVFHSLTDKLSIIINQSLTRPNKGIPCIFQREKDYESMDEQKRRTELTSTTSVFVLQVTLLKQVD